LKPAMIDLMNGWSFAEINASKENPYGLTSIQLTPWFSSMLARIQIVSPKLYEGKYFKHYHGGSWHSWDGEIIWWFYNHGPLFVKLIILAVFIFCIMSSSPHWKLTCSRHHMAEKWAGIKQKSLIHSNKACGRILCWQAKY
jgi:hypothetical protein